MEVRTVRWSSSFLEQRSLTTRWSNAIPKLTPNSEQVSLRGSSKITSMISIAITVIILAALLLVPASQLTFGDPSNVQICHNGRTISVNPAAIETHIAHGDTVGLCAGYGYGIVVICHIPPGNPDNAHTLTVGASAVSAHLAHGDTLGQCE